MIALIPARAGSKRIPGKNTRLLADIPLFVHAIVAAQYSGVFDDGILVASDDEAILSTALAAGCHLMRRPPVSDEQPDIEWVRSALKLCVPRPESFAILRPTSPFRSAETIQRAYRQFQQTQDTQHSLRAVEPVRQHPFKMWKLDGEMKPFWPGTHSDGTPFHSSPTQTLPAFYVQNSSLEMAWTWVVEQLHSISGRKVAPFLTHGYEGFALDDPADWPYAEYLIATGQATLPAVAPMAAAALSAPAAP